MALKDKLQEYALIAEIVGGIAIVCSLIFVGLQIRQNAAVTEINAYQLLVSQITDLNSLIIQDTALAQLLIKAKNAEPLTEVESEKILRFSANLIRHGDMAWQLYQRGIIDERTLQGMMGIVAVHITYPAIRAVWDTYFSSTQNPEFRDYLENFAGEIAAI